MAYMPAPPPAAYDPMWMRQEFSKIREALFSPVPFEYLETQHAAPAKPRDGMIVLADGTDWDPGAGKGYYGYFGGAWQLLNDGSQFGSNANGRWQKFSNGLMMQSGLVNPSGGDHAVTFPVAFPTGYFVFVSLQPQGTLTSDQLLGYTTDSIGLTTFIVRPRYSVTASGTGIASQGFRWVAIGFKQ